MRKIFILISILIYGNLNAQMKISTEEEIISTKISDDNKLFFATTPNQIQVYELPNFKLIKSWNHELKFPTILNIFPNSDFIILKENSLNINEIPANKTNTISSVILRKNSIRNKILFYEKDSSHLIQISTQKNIFNFSSLDFAIPLQNLNDKILIHNSGYSSRKKTSIQIITNGIEKEYFSDDLIIEAKVSTDFKQLGIICINNATRQAYLVIKSIENFNSILKSEDLPNLKDFEFSKNTEEIIALRGLMFGNDSLEFRNIFLPQKIEKIKLKANFENIQLDKESENLYLTSNSSYFEIDTKKREPVFEIQNIDLGYAEIGTIIKNRNNLITSGFNISKTGKADLFSKNEIQIRSFNDLKNVGALSTTNEIFYEDEKSFQLQVNSFPNDNTVADFKLSGNKKIVAISKGTLLQIWNTKSRKKICEWNFSGKITGIPDKTGNNILVVESSTKNTRDKFFHKIDLEKASLQSFGLQKSISSGIEFFGNIVSIICDPRNDNHWLISDQSKNIFSISGETMQPTAIEFYGNIQSISLTNFSNKISAIIQNQTKYDYGIIDLNENKFSKILESNLNEGLIIDNNVLLIDPKKDNQIQQWQDNRLIKTFSFPTKIFSINLDHSSKTILIETQGKTYNQIFFWKNSNIVDSIQLKSFTHNPKLLNEFSFMDIDENIKTYFNNYKDFVIWNLPTQKTHLIQFDVSPSGRFFLYQNKIFDLRTNNQIELDKYNSAVLLNDNKEIEWIENFSTYGYNNNKPFFQLIRNSETNIEKKSKNIILNDYSQSHSIFSYLPNRNWMISMNSYNFLNEKFKVNPILWNISTMDAFEFPIKFDKQPFVYFLNNEKFDLCVSEIDADFKLKCKHHIFQISPFKLIKEYSSSQSIPFEETDDKLFFEIDISTIQLKKLINNGLEVKKVFYAGQNLSSYATDSSQSKLIAGTENGKIIIWDIKGSQSPIAEIKSGNSPISQIKIAKDKIFALSTDGLLSIISLKEFSVLARIQFLELNEELRSVMYTPKGYYKADPEILDAVHFVKKGKIIPLSSFELSANRPDKVYASIGFADTTMIKILENSRLFRLQKLGVKESDFSSTISRPTINILNNEDSVVVTNNPNFDLKLSIQTISNPIKNLFISNNGVPLKSRFGIAINSSTNYFEEKIPLIEGKNNISVFAVDANGIESTEENLEIFYRPKEKLIQKIIFVGVGVSNYSDTNYNLRFASKDINDLATYSKTMEDSNETFMLLNEDATKENIIALREKLLNTKPEDIVMISFSGHGVLDTTSSKNEFYFCPTDMDFANPSKNGISISNLEDLLDGIPAMRRLVLMDACHSGDIPMPLSTNANLSNGVKEFRKKGGEIIPSNKNAQALQERQSLKMMKDLFSDFSRNNGAFMISAAAGNEYAFEGTEWNNGVFTTSFIKSFMELKQNLNSGKTITVRDLRRSVNQKVLQLTNKAQTPTSRQENGKWNWNF